MCTVFLLIKGSPQGPVVDCKMPGGASEPTELGGGDHSPRSSGRQQHHLGCKRLMVPTKEPGSEPAGLEPALRAAGLFPSSSRGSQVAWRPARQGPRCTPPTCWLSQRRNIETDPPNCSPTLNDMTGCPRAAVAKGNVENVPTLKH